VKPLLLLLALLAGSAFAVDIPARQRELHVPAVSIAVIENGRIVRTEVYGDGINPETVFQAASISKPVAAMAALHMSQHGNFTLDEDVNNKLKSWKVPAHRFSGKPVTVRGILSHSAGLTVSGFPGYAAGAPVPSLVAILNGAPPANTKAILVDIEPGSRWRYSGGGFTVLQQLMIDRMNGWTFPQIMERMVLSRIGMKHSTFTQPLPELIAANAAKAHDGEGRPIAGNWHTYPEMAAAGLWTTPSDLALWAIEVRNAWHGRSNKIIERTTAHEMLTRQKADYGLGVGLEGSGPTLIFGHDGVNAGYRCILKLSLESGNGAVIMTNGDQGRKLADEILASLQIR
jgi:CubicO group peptidase (beta-lactamase class C family)